MEEKRENQCVVAGCNFDKYEGHDKCILHCEKNADTAYPTFNAKFTEYFNVLVTCSLNSSVSINRVHFPPKSNLELILTSIKNLHFSDCHFSDDCAIIYYISEKYDIPMYYEQSTRIILKKHNNINQFAFWFSIFPHNCVIDGLDNNSNHRTPYLIDCNMNNLILRNLQINHEFRNYNKNKPLDLPELILENVAYNCSLKYQHTKKLSITQSVFKGSFDINADILEHLEIRSTTFEKSFSITKEANKQSYIENMVVKNTVFDGFFTCSNLSFNCVPKFDLLIFNSYTNFSLTKFNKGIELSKCGFNSVLNFSGSSISDPDSNIPRETYRIIKHSFDNIGNTIEANKYFALEMKAHLRDLPWKWGNYSEIVLLWINRITSNFGQNWWLPILHLIWFNLVLAGIHTFLKDTGKKIIVN